MKIYTHVTKTKAKSTQSNFASFIGINKNKSSKKKTKVGFLVD